MRETRGSIATRIHKYYEPDDKTCTWMDKDWFLAKEIYGLQSRIAELEEINAIYMKQRNEAMIGMKKKNDKIRELKEQNLQLAKLAADKPMFSSPVRIVRAKAIRDRVLKGKDV